VILWIAATRSRHGALPQVPADHWLSAAEDHPVDCAGLDRNYPRLRNIKVMRMMATFCCWFGFALRWKTECAFPWSTILAGNRC
jgi:hypothetical protein